MSSHDTKNDAGLPSHMRKSHGAALLRDTRELAEPLRRVGHRVERFDIELLEDHSTALGHRVRVGVEVLELERVGEVEHLGLAEAVVGAARRRAPSRAAHSTRSGACPSITEDSATS